MSLFLKVAIQGALTHGDRRATESRDLSKFNYDNKYGRKALESVMRSIAGCDAPLVPPPATYRGSFFKGWLQLFMLATGSTSVFHLLAMCLSFALASSDIEASIELLGITFNKFVFFLIFSKQKNVSYSAFAIPPITQWRDLNV